MLLVLFSSCRKTFNFGQHNKKEKTEILDLDFTVNASVTLTYQIPMMVDGDVNMILTNSTLAIRSVLDNNTYTYTGPTLNPAGFKDLILIGSVDIDGGKQNSVSHCGTHNTNTNVLQNNVSIERLINLHITVTAGTKYVKYIFVIE